MPEEPETGNLNARVEWLEHRLAQLETLHHSAGPGLRVVGPLEITDDAGNGVLTVTPLAGGGSELRLLDTRGHGQLILRAGPDGAGIHAIDGTGNTRFVLAQAGEDAGWWLHDVAGELTAQCVAQSEGTSLLLYDAAGKAAVRLPPDPGTA